MGQTIFPTENDVAINPGEGRRGNEANMSAWGRAFLLGGGYVIRGMNPSPGGSGATSAPGECVLDGKRLETNTSLDCTIPSADGTYFFWLRPNKVGGIVDAVAPLIFTSTSDPNTHFDDGVRLFKAVREEEAITSFEDMRRGPPTVRIGEYVGNGSTAGRSIETYRDAIKPVSVVVWSSDPRIFAWRSPFIRTNPLVGHHGIYMIERELGGHLYHQWFRAAKVWEPGLIGSGNSAETTITVSGVKPGDPAIAGYDGIPIGSNAWSIEAFVSAVDTVLVRITNNTGSNQTPA